MEFRTIPVGEMMANAYVLYQPERDDALVIDPGAQADRILSVLDGRRLSGIVLTHGHVDHIGAVAALRGSGTPVYIHSADAQMLTDPALSLAALFDAAPSQGAADHLLQEGEMELAGVKLQVLHTPGHTPGGISLLAEGHLFTGDTLFAQGVGRTDLPGGDWDRLAQSLRRLLQLDGGIVVHPGHGPSTTIAVERRCAP